MIINADSPDDYIAQVPPERKEAISKLRKVILENIPDGFEERMSYGTIGYVVPHSVYPPGYHCDIKLPLPFLNIASQKNFIAVYHMGIFADEELLKWFKKAYSEQSELKLDMGKSCIRFKKPDKIPFRLIGELASKLTANEWISIYEKKIKLK